MYHRIAENRKKALERAQKVESRKQSNSVLGKQAARQHLVTVDAADDVWACRLMRRLFRGERKHLYSLSR